MALLATITILGQPPGICFNNGYHLQTSGKIRYSGMDWRVEISPEANVQSIAASEQVIVNSVDVGVFQVMSKQAFEMTELKHNRP